MYPYTMNPAVARHYMDERVRDASNMRIAHAIKRQRQNPAHAQAPGTRRWRLVTSRHSLSRAV